MTLPKLLFFLAVILFGSIGILALFKKPSSRVVVSKESLPLEIKGEHMLQTVIPAAEVGFLETEEKVPVSAVSLPDANRIEELFTKEGTKLPFVETVTYKSHVSWLKGRPAWLSDYASHYQTSRHFIARSLNEEADYFKQEVAEGNRFNVFRKDKNIEFYLLVDTSRCRMWFYSIDLDEKKKVLLKTYAVGLGRLDASKASGLLTPLGAYKLGDRVAIYKPKTMGIYQGKKTEMITVFGSRWIPFEKEIHSCTAPAKGLGIHGTPWTDQAQGELLDQANGIGKYESDGCIRLATPDMEELFAIIITKPTTIEIVPDFTKIETKE